MKINGYAFIGVFVHYRLGAYGLLAGEEMRIANLTNIALQDIRIAMIWVRQNIQFFGGSQSINLLA